MLSVYATCRTISSGPHVLTRLIILLYTSPFQFLYCKFPFAYKSVKKHTVTVTSATVFSVRLIHRTIPLSVTASYAAPVSRVTIPATKGIRFANTAKYNLAVGNDIPGKDVISNETGNLTINNITTERFQLKSKLTPPEKRRQFA